MSNSIVIIPTYNEIENIESIVRAVFSLHKPFDILIVDDNSPDKTADKVIELQKEFGSQLFLEKREKKAGLGTAYVLVSNGLWQKSMIIYLKWMPIFLIIQLI